MNGICTRCGQVLVDGGGAVAGVGGELAERLRGPVALCGDCSGLLVEWLGPRASRPARYLTGARVAMVDNRTFHARGG